MPEMRGLTAGEPKERLASLRCVGKIAPVVYRQGPQDAVQLGIWGLLPSARLPALPIAISKPFTPPSVIFVQGGDDKQQNPLLNPHRVMELEASHYR